MGLVLASLEKILTLPDMQGFQVFRQEDFRGLPQQFPRTVAEHFFGLCIDECYFPFVVDDEQRVRSAFENCFEFFWEDLRSVMSRMKALN